MESIPPKKSRLAALKTVSPATWLGALATLAFLVLCQFDNTVIRWWLMLPLAIAGGALLPMLYGHLADVSGQQQGYWVMLPWYALILFGALFGSRLRRWG